MCCLFAAKSIIWLYLTAPIVSEAFSHPVQSSNSHPHIATPTSKQPPSLRLRLLFLPLAVFPPIQHIMLQHKHRVDHKTDIAQRELDRVTRQPAPIVLQARVNQQLRDGQDAADEVEQDLLDGPADGRLAKVVGVDLGEEFY